MPSRSVDLPVPFSPTMTVMARSKATSKSFCRKGRQKGYAAGSVTFPRSSQTRRRYGAGRLMVRARLLDMRQSIELRNLGVFDHLGEAGDVGLERRGELLWRIADRLLAGLNQHLAHLRIVERLRQRLLNGQHDVGRRAGRHEYPV